MTKNEWIDTIIKKLHQNPDGLDLRLVLKGRGDDFNNAISELHNKGIIRIHHQFTYWDVLTPLGYKVAEQYKNYDDFLVPRPIDIPSAKTKTTYIEKATALISSILKNDYIKYTIIATITYFLYEWFKNRNL